MPPEKNMTTFFISIFLILLAIAGGVWWYVFFGRPNPPLPRASVTVQSSTAPTAPAGSSAAPSSTVVSSTPTSSDDGDVNPQLPEQSLNIDNASFNVEVASTILQQARGLSNRPSLGANDGMLFVFSSGSVQSFWMKDMNFPLDMIWISGNTVVGFAQNAPAEPNTAVPSQIFYSPANTDKVLEVNAGTVAKYNIQVGDTVTIVS
ncbi:MAG TPA: DUF192 domain-containing protein [Candidatus Paceibacterota bacterium]|nr:DUF192 domain-containing protein [Candidatus Paceibacterota bacterium]